MIYSCIQLRTYQLAIFCVSSMKSGHWPNHLTFSKFPSTFLLRHFPLSLSLSLSLDRFLGSPRDITADHVHNTFYFIDPPLMRSNTFSSCRYENFRQLARIMWHYPLLTLQGRSSMYLANADGRKWLLELVLWKSFRFFNSPLNFEISSIYASFVAMLVNF